MPNRTRLADTRRPMTLAEAEAALQQLAGLRCQLERRQAEAEAELDRIKQTLVNETAPLQAAIEAGEQRLLRYVDANPGEFVKPKSVKTEFGKFGRRTSTRVEIDDEAAAIDHLKRAKLDSAFTVITKIDKPGLKKLLEAGEEIPGAYLDSGEFAYYEIDRALVRQARDLNLAKTPNLEAV